MAHIQPFILEPEYFSEEEPLEDEVDELVLLVACVILRGAAVVNADRNGMCLLPGNEKY